MLIDTHSHIYDSAFDPDREEAIEAAKAAGVTALLMPAIDSQSHETMLDTARRHEGYCLPMIGLHPTSVNDNPDYSQELSLVEHYLASPPMRFYAVGEVGLDLYWDQRWEREQMDVLRRQIELSLQYDLPLAIHTRQAMPQMCEVLSEFSGRGMRGVMHAFSGTEEDYERIRSYGDFLVGIGGTVTYKKGGSAPLVASLPLCDIVLETDCPYLPPVPFRGKRNQSAYVSYVCEAVASIKNTSFDEVAAVTSASAKRMFGL